MLAPVWLVYYLLPDEILTFDREHVLLAAFGLAMMLEAARLWTRTIFPGFREYEKHQISAFGWAAIGITAAFIFFPMAFVIPAVTGIGWIDPLIGEMRRRGTRGYPWLPFAAYFLIVVGSLQIWSDIEPVVQPILALSAASAAIIAEKPSLKHLDDDFLMLVIPLAVMHGLNELIKYLA